MGEGQGGKVLPRSLPRLKTKFDYNERKLQQAHDFIGERDGIRTHDPLIKSQMLYRLSYALP
jgi:hypothetical protein